MQTAVLIPCRNEAQAIAAVVGDFRRSLPTAAIYVYDNNSSDDTADIAKAAGAIVKREALPGKGNVLRRMFADVDADIYVIVDGDDTYDAASAPGMIQRLVDESLDMVSGVRVATSGGAYRFGHVFGNRMLTGLVACVFGNRLKDLLSGYRVFSRRFVKSFPALSAGFEIETELSVHALELRLPIAEIDTPYRERPTGSASKLNTLRDGVRILRTIVGLIKEERPLAFFSTIAAALAIVAAALGAVVIDEYVRTGLVPRLPSAVLATGLAVTSFLSFLAGLILDSVARGRREMKRLHYLAAGRSAS